jgi:hypothetical protein
VLMLLVDGLLLYVMGCCVWEAGKGKAKLARAAILSLRSFFCIEETFRCRKDLFYAVVFVSISKYPRLTYQFFRRVYQNKRSMSPSG